MVAASGATGRGARTGALGASRASAASRHAVLLGELQATALATARKLAAPGARELLAAAGRSAGTARSGATGPLRPTARSRATGTSGTTAAATATLELRKNVVKGTTTHTAASHCCEGKLFIVGEKKIKVCARLTFFCSSRTPSTDCAWARRQRAPRWYFQKCRDNQAKLFPARN